MSYIAVNDFIYEINQSIKNNPDKKRFVGVIPLGSDYYKYNIGDVIDYCSNPAFTGKYVITEIDKESRTAIIEEPNQKDLNRKERRDLKFRKKI